MGVCWAICISQPAQGKLKGMVLHEDSLQSLAVHKFLSVQAILETGNLTPWSFLMVILEYRK